jgi:coenzyme F420 biosynthesis associated uncharacterized protein
MDVIDWRAAQRIGELVAGSPPYGGVRASSVQPRAYEFAQSVSSYSGLAPTSELPRLEAVDRASWIAANLSTMRPLLAPLTERMTEDGRLPRALRGPLRSASGALLGAQVGALTGMLSQRVLGQYDVALLDSSVRPRLLLLAPNLAQASRNLGVDREELVLWVSIHEITHAVQFSGAPWLREHLAGMLTELIEGLQVAVSGKKAGEEESRNGDAGREDDDDAASGGGVGRWIASLGERMDGWGLDANDLREMVEMARRGQLLRLTLGEERWALVERMQAAMSLIEGHAEHVMDAVGAEVLPSLPRMRAALDRRRMDRGLPWRVLERLLGLELKLRQYETGRRFCDAVVQAGGPQALARVWAGAQALPSAAELQDPAAWLARVQAEPATAGGPAET